MPKSLRRIIFLVLIFGCAGCATVTGPSVSRQEIQQATEELQVKSLAFKINQIKRINEIGYRIARQIPQADIKVKSRSFIGLFCLPREKIVEKLFNTHLDRGVVIGFVLEGTPAFDAGIRPGDILVAVNKVTINSVNANVEQKLKPGEEAVLTIFRSGQRLDLPAKVGMIPVNVSFTVVDDQSVNAAAGTNQIYTTYGLINFAKSDDEIAAVIGHELAHLSRGHVNRMQGGNIVGMIAAIGLGIAAEVAAPGSGEVVMRGVSGIGGVFRSRFSRDLEREADYFGVKFIYLAGYDPMVAATVHERFAIEIPGSMTKDFFSSHPSSPERSVRIKKAIEELKKSETQTPQQSDPIPADPQSDSESQT